MNVIHPIFEEQVVLEVHFIRIIGLHLQVKKRFDLMPIAQHTGLDIIAPARRPMAGYFHGGQVNFDEYQPVWQALFPQKLCRPLLYAGKGQFRAYNFSKLPAQLASARKSKDPALPAHNTQLHNINPIVFVC